MLAELARRTGAVATVGTSSSHRMVRSARHSYNVLSLPFAIERMTPLLQEVVNGDLNTAVPTA